jgi:glycosyltransferase involved in cell wall biosynthesis
MKKVLIFVFTPTYGGPHNQVNRLYQPLREQHYESVLCVHQDFEPKWEHHFRQLGVRVLKYDFKRLRFNSFITNNYQYLSTFFKDISALETLIRNEKPDVVQVCGLLNIQAVLAAKRAGVPVVWQLLSTFSPPPMRFVYGQLVKRWANSIMSTGSLVAHKHYLQGNTLERTFPFYPPVETSRFVAAADKKVAARRFFDIPEDAIVIGTVGNRNRQKSHDQFVQIAKQVLTRTDKEVYFVIVGAITPSYQPTYTTLVEQFIKDNKLENRIKLFQSTIPVDTILSGFDAFLLSSMAEGVPTVLLEAMSIGVPIVSTDVGAIPEIVKEGVNGFLYRFGQNERAAEQVLRLIDDQKLRLAIAGTNAGDAKTKFDTVICSEVHKKAYDFALAHQAA